MFESFKVEGDTYTSFINCSLFWRRPTTMSWNVCTTDDVTTSRVFFYFIFGIDLLIVNNEEEMWKKGEKFKGRILFACVNCWFLVWKCCNLFFAFVEISQCCKCFPVFFIDENVTELRLIKERGYIIWFWKHLRTI